MNALPYLVVYSLPVVFGLAVMRGGWWPAAVPLLVFVAIPLIDGVSGHDTHDPDDDELNSRADNPLYDGLLRMWVPVQIACIAAGVAIAVADPSPSRWVPLAMACGVVTGGGGINIAHELMHRAKRADRALAEVLMTSVSYPWFCVEHVLGHHRHVCTPADPGTSRLGESLWAFLPRTLWGGLYSAWALESARVQRRSIGLGWRDRRVRFGLWLVALYVLVAGVGGVAAVGFVALQSLTAVLLVEAVNYIEHYGLQRTQLSSGRYERVQPHHSWNSTHRFTAWFLFNLPRHSDHHAWASRPYWKLRAWPDAPAMPFGYPTMLLIATVPPLWRSIMDPRVLRVRGGVTASPAPREASPQPAGR